MRFVLATALLCACTALAQDYDGSDDYDQDLQARDARDQVWKAAHGHGGPPPQYRGFQEMAHKYPGHPLKSFGAKHPRDVEDENGLGDDEGFIDDDTAGFANNVARSIRNAYKHVGNKAEESVQHAKAKAGYHDGGKHFGGYGHGGPWKVGPRDVEDENDDPEVWEEGFDDDEEPSLAARDVEDEPEEGEVDWNPDPADFDMEDDDDDDDDEDDDELAKRDVDEDEEVDWNPDPADFDMGDDDEDDEDDELAKRDADDEEEVDWNPDPADFDLEDDGEDVPELAERDVEEDEDEEDEDVENDADAPALTAFDDDDEDLPDPKLQLEEEFDEGLNERDEEGGLLERDAEPEAFNFFGFGGKKDDHKRPGFGRGGHAEHDAMKKGMKHVFARDSGLDPEDDSLEGAYDPISEDPNLSDEEFYAEEDEADEDEVEDEDDDLEKREAKPPL